MAATSQEIGPHPRDDGFIPIRPQRLRSRFLPRFLRPTLVAMALLGALVAWLLYSLKTEFTAASSQQQVQMSEMSRINNLNESLIVIHGLVTDTLEQAAAGRLGAGAAARRHADLADRFSSIDAQVAQLAASAEELRESMIRSFKAYRRIALDATDIAATDPQAARAYAGDAYREFSVFFAAARAASDAHGAAILRQAADLDRQFDRTLQRLAAISLAGLLLTMGFAYLAARGMTRRLNAIAAAMQALCGDKGHAVFLPQVEALSREPRNDIQAMAEAVLCFRSTLVALVHQKSILRALLDSIPDAAWIKGRDCRFLTVNRAYAEMVGEAPEDTRDCCAADFWPQEVAEAFAQLDAAVLQSGRPRCDEMVLKTAAGEEKILQLIRTPVRGEDGEILGIAGIGRDISEHYLFVEELDHHRNHLQELVEQRTRELEEAKEEAECASRAKSEFLARMSHEIRTPMNAVIGFSNLALKLPGEPRVRDYLEKISVAAKGLLGIINAVLDFSKIEAGRLELDQAPFDTAAVCGNLKALAESLTQEKGLRCVFAIDPDVPARLEGDALRLTQILTNLIANGAKFTDTGEVRVACRVAERKEHSIRLQFTVADTGIGMSTEVQSRLFQSFMQADSSTCRRYGGTGLGLVICKHLVELMGGHLEVESAPGRGSTFRFTLPFGIPEDTTGSYPAEAGPSRRDIQGTRILLAEDNAFNQQVALCILESAGAQVDIAADGHEAIDRLSSPIPYDAVLMDMMMPLVDGLEATRRIRRLAHRRDLPIIALTANAMKADRERCLEAGMNDFLPKPFEEDELLAVLIKWTGPRARSAAGPQATGDRDLADLPGIDTAVFLARLNGKADSCRRLLGVFRRHYDDYHERLREAARTGDREGLIRLAHTLKGAAGQIAAQALSTAAASLQWAYEQGDRDACVRALEQVGRELDRVLTGLDRLERISPLPGAPGQERTAA
ncbi:MAG: ATP-binding protein [Actinomycetota bacterium]